MKILTTEQIRKVDQLTIAKHYSQSIELMENAARAMTDWFINSISREKQITVLCGPGNNGGDGLAVARLLQQEKYSVCVFLLNFSTKYSNDNQINQDRLRQLGIPIVFIDPESNFDFSTTNILIDALFGSGLSRPITTEWKAIIDEVNKSKTTKIAIDIPSGLYADKANQTSDPIIKANKTLTFQIPKLAFFLPEAAQYIGKVHYLDIGLDKEVINAQNTLNYSVDEIDIQNNIKHRNRFSHKGTYGHSLLICGSKGKIGAAVLATKAALRSGTGLATAYIPACGYTILQTAVPEAMCITDKKETIITSIPNISAFSAIGIGPGLGTNTQTIQSIRKLFAEKRLPPLVIDADAINCMAKDKEIFHQLPENTILTPHPKEFARMVGKTNNQFERLEKQKEFSRRHNCIVVLKDAITSISLPDGTIYFNTTGNAALATAGTGDVLTGIITGMLAQGYTSKLAAIIGVYLHGLSADIAIKSIGQEAVIAGDIINHLKYCFQQLKKNN